VFSELDELSRRPRGRSGDSSPRRRAVVFTQLASPRGLPRRTRATHCIQLLLAQRICLGLQLATASRRGDLANFLRRLALPRTVKHCSLTTLRQNLVKIGAQVTRHSLLRDVATGRSGGDAHACSQRSSTAPARKHVATAGRLWLPRRGASVGQNAGCMEKTTRTRERQSSGCGLAGRCFGRSEPRSRGCGGEKVKTSPRDRRGGGRSVL